MKLATTQRLYDYWSRLRGARPAPERREIEPSDIRDMLGDTFILEAAADDRFPFRLAGTRLCAAFCRELKDRDFLRLWNAEDHEAIQTLLVAITEDAAAAVIGFKGTNENGKTLSFELLLLPLRNGEHRFSRVLGACTPVEQPYWLGIQPVMTLDVQSVRLIWPDETPHFLRRAAAPRNKGAEIFRLPDTPNTRRYGHLTVYEGGRQ